MSIRIINADVYLLNWHRLASEHCASTSELHPVNLQPNFDHQFIISCLLIVQQIVNKLNTPYTAMLFVGRVGTTGVFIDSVFVEPAIAIVDTPRKKPHSYDIRGTDVSFALLRKSCSS